MIVGDGLSCKTVHSCDGRKNHRFICQLDAKTGVTTRNFISIPIVIDKIIRGGIIVTNKIIRHDESSSFPHFTSTSSSTERHTERHSERNELPEFGPMDEVLLGFIAANAVLCIKNNTSINRKSSNRTTIVTPCIERPPPSDVETALQLLAVRACSELDAEMVSVFAYNDMTKRLESTVSNDPEGMSMPIDRGITGTSFRMGRVINVQETDSDERYNRDVDAKIGYKTHSLLCAPIMDVSGRPVGVIQALNKKSIPHFSRHDETLLCDFCRQAFTLLQDVDYVSEHADNYNTTLVAKFLAAVVAASTISNMVKEVRRIIMEAVLCDYVGTYSYVCDSTGDYLLCHNISDDQFDDEKYNEKIPLREIPIEILDALKSGTMTEMNLSSKNMKANIPDNFLPGIKARHALIYPLHGNLNYKSGVSVTVGEDHGIDNNGKRFQSSSVLIIVRNHSNIMPFLIATRDLLELFIVALETSIKHVINRQIQDTAIINLESNFLLANGTLETLQEYVILLCGSGKILAWNKDISPLIGTNRNSQINSEKNSDTTVTPMEIDTDYTRGSWMKNFKQKEEDLLKLPKDQHFSRWFKGANCVELFTDISNSTDLRRNNDPINMLKSALFTSSEYPHGVWIEYQLSSLNIENPINNEINSMNSNFNTNSNSVISLWYFSYDRF